MAADSDNSALDARGPGPALRLVDRRAYVGFPPMNVAPGVAIADFALQIPDVTFPMNITGGAGRYQKKRLEFGLLELTIAADVINRRIVDLQRTLGELDDVKLHFRPGYLEAQARLRTPERAPVTFKIAFDGDGERLAVYCYDVHATMLHLLGIDHTRLTYRHNGIERRLTDVHGSVIPTIVA